MKNKSLGDTIKKLVESSLEKRLKEFESEINKKIESIKTDSYGKRIDFFEKKNTDLDKGIKYVMTYMKENEKNVEDIEKKLKDLKVYIKKEITEISAKLSEGEKYSEIKETIAKNNELIEKANIEIKSLKKTLEETKDLEELLKKTNLKDILRNIEILRTRSQWLEGHLESYNLKPIMDKIHELEIKIDSIKLSSPLIVE